MKNKKLLKKLKQMKSSNLLHNDIHHTLKILKFLQNRLIEVHKEKKNVDYMLHFDNIIMELEKERHERNSMDIIKDFLMAPLNIS